MLYINILINTIKKTHFFTSRKKIECNLHICTFCILSLVYKKVLNLGGMFGIIKRKCYLCREIT